jgi:intein-encoded DNA endonuclease-like protein
MTKSKTNHHKRTPLEQLRLDRDWTYLQLTERIREATGIKRSESTVTRACKGKPHRDGVANAIEKFLKAERRRELGADRTPPSMDEARP